MTLQHKAWAALQLIRPELPAAAGLCVVVGQVIALGRPAPLPLTALGFAMGFLVSASAMIFNDYFDIVVDRVNAPQWPLPSGRLAPAEALVLGGLAAALGLASAWAIHPIVFELCLLVWLLDFAYNWKLKAAGLWGNLAVAASVAMTFILGGVSVGQAAQPIVWIFGLIAFVFDLAEEIAGDAMDMAGDRQRSSKSLAIVYGQPLALRISGLLFGLVVLLTTVPLVWGEASLGYFVPIALMDALIVVFAVRLVRSPSPQIGRVWMRGLYLSASLGLLAFIFGVLWA